MKHTKSIGIFGGTFDPIHKGHIAIAKQAMKQLSLTRVYFVPTSIPPHKQLRSSATAKHRLAMVKLALEGQNNFKVSSLELQRGGISYTIDTVKSFKKLFPSEKLVLIVGEDNLTQFTSWKSPKTILQLCSLAVYKRKNISRTLINYTYSYEMIKGPFLPVSSTEVRQKIEHGKSISRLLPKSVLSYIKQHSLYQAALPIIRERNSHEINRSH
jgi:nicotinate-nucleotide adenylyltransferase